MPIHKLFFSFVTLLFASFGLMATTATIQGDTIPTPLNQESQEQVTERTAHAPSYKSALVTPSPADLQRLKQIKKQTAFGPGYKNPLAAGRLEVLNRTAPTPLSRKEQLTGPAYKNKKPVLAPVDANATPAPTRRKLTGPRYKNRTAKSGKRQ